jgi:hypothetical protein
MNYASDGGGGGGNLIVDHGTLDGVVAGLGAAGDDLDAAGSSAPGGGDYGDAGALIATVLAGVAEAGARVAFEAKTLSAVVGECNDVASSADQAAAESYIVTGK